MFEQVEATTTELAADSPAPLSYLLTDEHGMLDAGETLKWLAFDDPGPEMVNLLAALASLQDTLTPSQRVDLLVQLERCESWMHAVKQQVFAGLADDAGNPSGRDCSPGKFEDTVLEAALAMRWSEWMVHDRMETGKEIVDRLPDTWQALARGAIDYWQASRLAKATRKIEDDDNAALLERRVLAKAPTQNHSETGKLIDRELIKADADGAEKRRKKARWWRKVTRSRDEDGMASLHMHGPVEDIATIDIALSRGAEMLKATGQVETMDQGRFDTAVSLATDFLRNQFVPTKSGRPTALNLITKDSTLDGDDDDPAYLDRWGPVTAQVARDLANGVPPRPGPFTPAFTREERAEMGRMYRRLFPYDDKYAGDDPDPPPPDPYDDTGPPDDVDPDDGQPPQRPAASAAAVDKSVGTIRALRVDPSTGWLLPPVGVRVDFGRAKDYFTGAVRQFVLERFRVCAFPGCAMPMSCLDADHWKARKDGGATDASTNAGPGCPHHNRTTRNRPGWDVEPNGDGTATLITPQGRRYPITPLNYLDT